MLTPIFSPICLDHIPVARTTYSHSISCPLTLTALTLPFLVYIFSTGDCVAPGIIQAAVLSGHTVARSIIEGNKDGFFLRDQIERFEFN